MRWNGVNGWLPVHEYRDVPEMDEEFVDFDVLETINEIFTSPTPNFKSFCGLVLEVFKKCEEGGILNPLEWGHLISVWPEFDPVNKVMKDQCMLDLLVNSSGMTNFVNFITDLAKRLVILLCQL